MEPLTQKANDLLVFSPDSIVDNETSHLMTKYLCKLLGLKVDPVEFKYNDKVYNGLMVVGSYSVDMVELLGGSIFLAKHVAALKNVGIKIGSDGVVRAMTPDVDKAPITLGTLTEVDESIAKSNSFYVKIKDEYFTAIKQSHTLTGGTA
jgi:hypothetical protein